MHRTDETAKEFTLSGTKRNGRPFPVFLKGQEQPILWLKPGSLGIEEIVLLTIIETKCHAEHFLNNIIQTFSALLMKTCVCFALFYARSRTLVFLLCTCLFSFNHVKQNLICKMIVKMFCKPLPWIHSHLIYMEMAFVSLWKSAALEFFHQG